MKYLAPLALAGTLALTVTAHAAGPDLVNCRYSNGLPIEPKSVCEALRRADERDRARAEQQRKYLEEVRRAEEELRAKREAEETAARELQAKRQREEEAERERQQRESEAEAARLQAERQRRQEELKKICGDDYRRVRTGMAFARVNQCAGPFRMVGQRNRADGVVTIYKRGRGYVYVMDDVVVGWDTY